MKIPFQSNKSRLRSNIDFYTSAYVQVLEKFCQIFDSVPNDTCRDLFGANAESYLDLKKLRSKIKAKKTQGERSLSRLEAEEDLLIQFEEDQQRRTQHEPPEEYDYGTTISTTSNKSQPMERPQLGRFTDPPKTWSQPPNLPEDDLDFDEEQLLMDLDTEATQQKRPVSSNWSDHDVISIDDSPMPSTSRIGSLKKPEDHVVETGSADSQRVAAKGELLIGKFHSNVQNDGITGELCGAFNI